MELPHRDERRKRHRLIDRWTDDFWRSCSDRELAWICLPHLIIHLRLHAEGTHPARSMNQRRAQKLWARRLRQTDRSADLVGEHLFFAFSENQRRSQAPVAELLGERRAAPVGAVDPRRMDGLGERAIKLVAELIAAAGAELPIHRRSLYSLVLRAARDLGWSGALLAASRPRSMVIGSTQSSSSRALALAAREAGIASVYIPHAPVLTETRLADLPVDAAALRGPRELDHYRSLGADSAALQAAGDPSVEVAGQPPTSTRDAVAFALPVDDPTALALLVGLTAAALEDGVIASPHPRADPVETRELLPDGWEIWQGRTLDLLRTGPVALIQASSGAGLEGLSLGIPTIELGFPEEEPNYPFLCPPHVPRVSTAQGLRDAVDAAAAASETERRRLRAWAAEWVCAGGAEAAQACAAVVERAAAAGVRPAAAWDAWT